MCNCSAVNNFPAFKSKNAASNTKIALGLKDDLDNFAKDRSAKSWKQIAYNEPDRWMEIFVDLMNLPDTTCAFNLTGVDVARGITRASCGNGTNTDKELIRIKETPRWWPRIEWMKDGIAVNNPFEDYHPSGWLSAGD